MRFTALLMFLVACATPVKEDAKFFTIQHGTVMFGPAMAQAERHCEKLGMRVRHLGTNETGFQTVSRFECY
jgi:hypothetical protein